MKKRLGAIWVRDPAPARRAPAQRGAGGPELDRRAAVLAVSSMVAWASACSGARAAGASGEPQHPVGEEGMTATEDLMREHGVLRRIFQVYDEVARRARRGDAVDPAPVARAAHLVRAFAEDYHERAEERWVFPVVRRDAALAPTVDVLLAQHARGRDVTDAILRTAAQGPAAGSAGATRLAVLCEAFNRMYRAHAAREDTVIFPALRAGVSRHEFDELGERMEQAERSSVGEGGFERAVVEVDAIERGLGINDLAALTAPAPEPG